MLQVHQARFLPGKKRVFYRQHVTSHLCIELTQHFFIYIHTTYDIPHTPFKSQLIIGDFLRLRIHRLSHDGSVKGLGSIVLHTLQQYAVLCIPPTESPTECSSMNTVLRARGMHKQYSSTPSSAVLLQVCPLLLYYPGMQSTTTAGMQNCTRCSNDSTTVACPVHCRLQVNMACLKVTIIGLKLERIPRLETMAAGSLRYHSHGTQRDLGCEGYKGYIPAQATVGREIKSQ